MTKRRDFIRKSVLGTAGITLGGIGFSAKSYGSIIGANETNCSLYSVFPFFFIFDIKQIKIIRALAILFKCLNINQ